MPDENTHKMTDDISSATNKKSRSGLIALLLLIVMIGWIGSGYLIPSDGNAGLSTKQDLKATPDLFTVAYTPSQAHEKIRELTINGVSMFSRRIDLKAEVEGKIEKIHAKESAYIEEGAVILHIEKRDRERRLMQAKEFVRQKELDYEAAKKLNEKGFQAETRLREEAALLEDARANLIAAEIALDNTVIKAPYGGWLERIFVEEGTLVGANVESGEFGRSNLATVIDISPLIVIGNVSERFISDISLGMPASLTLIDGTVKSGKVSYVGSIADETTRTFRIEIEVPNPNNQLYPLGSTAQITLPIRTAMVHDVTLSTLTLGHKGELGVHIFQKDEYEAQDNLGQVIFYPVQIFTTSPKTVWIRGLPDNANIITRGHGFVENQQRVLGYDNTITLAPEASEQEAL